MSGPLRKPRVKGTQQEHTAPPFTLRVSLPMSIVLAAVLAVAAGWSFFMGFMVGRGQNPESRLEQITGLGRGGNHGQPPENAVSIPAASETASLTETGNSTDHELIPSQDTNRVPQPLQDPEANRNASQPSPTPGVKPAEEAASAYPFTRPSGESLTAWGITPTGEKEKKAQSVEVTPSQGGAKTPTTTPQTLNTAVAPKYDFLYQVAAFKKSSEADNLCATLTSHGFKASSQKNGKVRLVLVNFRGTEEDAASLRDTLQRMHLGKPILVARKNVTSTPSKKRKR
ncbi:MAG: SPOR domain-containing protein [Desulfovibrio sp.]|nr:SPOR domain-containing protein [Desulfovibrio sp.]